jgi:hypothetical protein
MRTIIAFLALALCASPAMSMQDFQAEFHAPATGSIEVGHIGFSVGLRSRADELGMEELTRLATYLREDLERALVQSNWLGVSVNEISLNVVIVDAVPNRPTMAQINRVETTHYGTTTAGGASLRASLIRGDNEVIAEFSYAWVNPSLDESANYGIWTDARQTFSRFSTSVADSLGVAPMPTS